MSNRYKSRVKVAVNIPSGGARYGFLTNLNTDDRAALLHQDLDEGGNGGTGVVFFGASRPKPPRAKKVSDGTTSFYGISSEAGAGLADGWVKISPSRGFPVPRTSSKSRLVYVDIAGGKYAWNQPTEVATQIGDDGTALGVTLAAGADKVWIGVNTITNVDGNKLGKPKRATKEGAGEDGVNKISTWIKYPLTTAIPEGWSV
jgi:hypothetical protein